MKNSHHPKALKETNCYSKVKKDMKKDSRRYTRRKTKEELGNEGKS